MHVCPVPNCGLKYENASAYRSHIRRKHRSVAGLRQYPQKLIRNNEQYSCAECDYVTLKRKDLSRHVSNCHKPLDLSSRKNRKKPKNRNDRAKSDIRLRPKRARVRLRLQVKVRNPVDSGKESSDDEQIDAEGTSESNSDDNRRSSTMTNPVEANVNAEDKACRRNERNINDRDAAAAEDKVKADVKICSNQSEKSEQRKSYAAEEYWVQQILTAPQQGSSAATSNCEGPSSSGQFGIGYSNSIEIEAANILSAGQLLKSSSLNDPTADVYCEFCYERFDSRQELRKHKVRTKHQVPRLKPDPLGTEDCILLDEKCEKRWQCARCTPQVKLYETERDLRRHIREVHQNLKRHLCQVCQKGFFSKAYLTKHISRCHTGVRPFLCDVCGKGFVVANEMRRHTACHSDAKPFQCDVCEEWYKTKMILKEHKISHKCCFCDEIFVFKHARLQHEKDVHGHGK